MDRLWAALSEAHRRSILDRLRERPRSVGELVETLGLAQPAVSKHLRVLREAGLVRVRTEAQRRIYAVDPAGLSALDDWLAPYRRLWNERLDALDRHLDRTAESHPTHRTTESHPAGADRTHRTDSADRTHRAGRAHRGDRAHRTDSADPAHRAGRAHRGDGGDGVHRNARNGSTRRNDRSDEHRRT